MAIKIEDLDRSNLAEVVSRVKQVRETILRARKTIAAGRGGILDTEDRRLKAELRDSTMADLEASVTDPLRMFPEMGQEAFIGDRNNILSGEFLEIGMLASRAVCRIKQGVQTGTGFLVGNRIAITNHHVIKDKTQASTSIFEFLAEDNTIGVARNVVSYVADPEEFFFSSAELDITLVALKESSFQPKLVVFGWLPLQREEGKILIADPVNIIQHPQGQLKRLTVHESSLVHLVDNSEAGDVADFCWYSGDTDKGSSGAPVFNNKWDVIAVHHAAIPDTDKNGNVLDINGKQIAAERKNDPGLKIRWIANEGVRISRIVTALENEQMDGEQAQIRDGLLDLWSQPLARRLGWLASLQATQQ